MTTIDHHIWYWPEYAPYYYRMTLLDKIAPPKTNTINVQDIPCNLHGDHTISVDLQRYQDWRESWFSFIPAVKQVIRHRQFFKGGNTLRTTNIRVIFYHVDKLRQQEWSMFLTSPFRIDIITRSLVAVDPAYLSKALLHRVPVSHQGITWKEQPWKASTDRIRELLCSPNVFQQWRETRDILYEWMLFDVNYEEPIYDLMSLLENHSLIIQRNTMKQLLSLLSLLSTNENREVMKPSIRATTSQHTFYVLEQCILIIAKVYHNNHTNPVN